MNIRFDLILSAILLWPTLLYGQDAKTITLEQKPVVMGQRWEVKKCVEMKVLNNVSRQGKIIEKVDVNNRDESSYKAQALAVKDKKVAKLSLNFGAVRGRLSGSTGTRSLESPVSKKSYTLIRLKDSYYSLDGAGEPVPKETGFLLLEHGKTELDLDRHGLLPPLPKRALKIGESFPMPAGYVHKLLSSNYKVRDATITLTGSKVVDHVLCAVFKIRFHAKVEFQNGVNFDFDGTGEVCTEIATSLHRSLQWQGPIVIGGSGTDPAGNPLQFEGVGKISVVHTITYPKVAKLPPVQIGRAVPQPGQVWEEQYEKKGNVSRRVKRDGEVISQERVRDSNFGKYTVTVLESSEKAVTKAKVVFGKLIKKTISPNPSEKQQSMSGGVFLAEQKKSGEGAPIIRKEDGHLVQGKLEKSITKQIKDIFLEDRSEILSALPKGLIQAGKVITVDPKRAMEIFGDDDNEVKSVSLQLVYQGTKLVNGRKAAFFLLSMELHGVAENFVHLRVKNTGEIYLDVATGWPVELKMNGIIKMYGEQSNEIGDKIVVDGHGPISMSTKLFYKKLKKKKKRF